MVKAGRLMTMADYKHMSGRRGLQENMQQESLHFRGCISDDSKACWDVCAYQVVFSLHVCKCTDHSIQHEANGQDGAMMMGGRCRSCRLSRHACTNLGSQVGMK